MKRFLIVIALLTALASPGFAIESDLLTGAGIDLYGSLDVRAGARIQNDPHQRRSTLREARLQFEATRLGESANLNLRADFIADDLDRGDEVDLESGEGFVDLREANVQLFPHPMADLKIGRQILTWGTGDLLFINDLFPKDWQAFFLGRDEEYLKAPSDAAMLSLFPGDWALDLVYTPCFDADRYIRGERLSFFNPAFGGFSGREAPVRVHERNDWFTEDEIALRASRNVEGVEAALYGYDGYWKSPVGMAPDGRATFPKLRVLGGSLRSALGDGLISVEAGYYDSHQDANGDDPFIPNSELRLLIGYERELASDFSGALQYYLERMLNYGAYRSSLPPSIPARDENRQVLTLRLTKLLLNQNLKLSLFTYASPTDRDIYLRPAVDYRASDTLNLFAGGNLFGGEDDHSFFGQFENNSNLYAGFRISF